MVTHMLEIFEIVAHLLATVVRVAVPGGVRAVIVESLLLKHQLLVLSRSRKRASRLTPWDRLLFGIGAFLVSPKRLPKIAIGIRPSTLLRFHRALIKRKYRLLFTSAARRRPGPKGPSKELIAAILEMKRRNPRFGCPRIAQQIANATYVSKLLSLAYLAPDLTEAILDGRQPPRLMVKHIRTIDMPLEWNAQRRLFSRFNE